MRIILILIVCILAGCNSVKKTMGFTQESPDEYTVMTYKKMEVPDGIYLPDPNQNMPLAQAVPPTDDTKELFVEAQPKKATTQDAKAEQALLKHLPTQPQSDIRALVNKDNKKPDHWGDQLLFWQKQVKGKPLDAAAEAERLKIENETVSSGS
jgi:uncharacterized lipoprotein